MKQFKTFTGIAAPLNRAHVDTDAIIPKQFLKSIQRTGFGAYCFDEWRFLDPGELGKKPDDRPLNTNFELNHARYQGAEILITGDNFGCGSSREHAVWALTDYGFKVVIAPSFADIFFNNCFKNGLLPIVLDTSDFFKAMAAEVGYQLTINLEEQTITIPNDSTVTFEIDAFRKHCLLEGLDEIGLTLRHAEDIKAFEKRQASDKPFLSAARDS